MLFAREATTNHVRLKNFQYITFLYIWAIIYILCIYQINHHE